MMAWLVKYYELDSSLGPCGGYEQAVIVAAGSLDDALAAVRAHVPDDPECSVDDIRSVEQIGDFVVRDDGTKVRTTKAATNG
jgi:hypothetical protein